MNGKPIKRHAAHPTEPALYLCGMPVLIDNQGDGIVDVGHAVSCADCRVVITFVRRCISVQGFTLYRERVIERTPENHP